MSTTFNWTDGNDGKVDFIIKQYDGEIVRIKMISSDAYILAEVLENLDAELDENLNDNEDEENG
jgi:hypothetical protein